MNFDKVLQEASKLLKNTFWRDFSSVGIQDEHYLDYIYAENRLYIIRDRITERYFFVEARNPIEAREIYYDKTPKPYVEDEED